jgi:hypothetical protein
MMKRLAFLGIPIVSVLIMAACSSVPIPGVSVGLTAPNLAAGVGPMASSAGEADFKKDEVLCLFEQDDPLTGRYYVGRVLTSASPATKNQAEVIYVEDGKKGWSAKVVPSHKADKPDFDVGKLVLYPSGWPNHEKISQDDYRFASWKPGHVTNNDELFKGLIEVDGDKYYAKYLRVPDAPLN